MGKSSKVIGLLVLIALLLLVIGIECFGASVSSKEETLLQSLPDGTLLESRNRKERENTSPGYWNHTALKSGDHIVESQSGKGVIQTSFLEYLSRDYSRILALEPVDSKVGSKAADVSETLVGLPFREFSSLRGRDTQFSRERGMNCVSVVRYSERIASGERLRLFKIPDQGFRHSELFKSPIVVR